MPNIITGARGRFDEPGEKTSIFTPHTFQFLELAEAGGKMMAINLDMQATTMGGSEAYR